MRNIVLENIYFGYGEHSVLIDFSLHIENKGIHVILGKSGSGKTTLLKLLSGVLFPKEGIVSINDRIQPDASHFLIPGYQKLAYLAQDFDLLPYHSVEENLTKAKLNSFDNNYEISEAVLYDLLGIKELLHKRALELSTGQKQRVALAVALLKNPDFLILDEPFSNLDLLNRSIIIDLLEVLRERICIIMSMHEAPDALAIADKLWIMNDGKIIDSGSPRQVYYHPKNWISAQLTGSVNRFSKSELIQFKADINSIHQIGDEHMVRPEQLFLNTMSGTLCHIKKQHFKGAYSTLIVEALGKSIEVASARLPDTNHRWKLLLRS